MTVKPIINVSFSLDIDFHSRIQTSGQKDPKTFKGIYFAAQIVT